jgi:hypothetical protein
MDGSRRSPGFASESSGNSTTATGLPRDIPSDRLQFPRLQLRGSAGFSPASLLLNAEEDARTKELGKNKCSVKKI